MEVLQDVMATMTRMKNFVYANRQALGIVDSIIDTGAQSKLLIDYLVMQQENEDVSKGKLGKCSDDKTRDDEEGVRMEFREMIREENEKVAPYRQYTF